MLGRKASLNSFQKFWGHGRLLPAMRGAACLQTRRILILAPCCNLPKHLPLPLLCKRLATCWLYPTVTPACTVDFGVAMKLTLHLKRPRSFKLPLCFIENYEDSPRLAHKKCYITSSFGQLFCIIRRLFSMSSLHKGDAIHLAKQDDQLLFGIDSLSFGASRLRVSRDSPRRGYWKMAERWFRIQIPIRCNMSRYEMFGWLLHKTFGILRVHIQW